MPTLLVDLLSDLEVDVTDESKPVSGILRKCITFARRAEAVQLREWALRELKGYEPEDPLPPYRALSAPVLIDGFTPRMQYTGQYLQLASPPLKPIRHHLDRTVDLRFSIDEIEATVARADASGALQLGPDNVAALIGFINLRVVPAYCQVTGLYWSVPVSVVQGIIGQVRTALIEFVDELQSEVDASGTAPSPAKTRAILAHTMPWIIAENAVVTTIHHVGDNVTDSSKTTIKNNRTKVSENSGTVVAASAHVQAGTQQGINSEKLNEFASFIRQLAPTLNLAQEDQTELESAVTEVESAAADPNAQLGPIRRRIERVKSAIGKGGPGFAQKAALGAADEVLAHLAEEGLHALGM